MKSKKLKGLYNQENKDWYNSGFIGGFRNCKEKVFTLLDRSEILCPARKDFIEYLKNETEKL